MALTAEQIRQSFEAKKKLLSGGVESRHAEKSEPEGLRPSLKLADPSSGNREPVTGREPVHGCSGSSAPPAQNNLPADVQPEPRTDTADSLRQENPARSGEARDSTQPLPTVEQGSVEKPLTPAQSRGGQKSQKQSLGISRPEPRSTRNDLQPQVPQAPEIELSVLASLYQYPDTCFPIFNEHARPEFFFSPVNQSFFLLLSDYFNEHGQADPQSFLQFLLDSGQLEKHGGSFFLSQLLSATSPPSALEYHLEILREKFVQRSLYKAAAELARKTVEPQGEDLFSLISQHQASIAELATGLAGARNGHLSFRRVSEIFGMTFDDTDNYFGDRVMAAGQPCTLLGPGDIGKSRLSLQLSLSMITGRDFLGMPTHAANKTWLFIQSENSCRRLYADLKNMLSGLELSESERSQVEEHLFIHTLENDYDSFLSLEDDKIYAKVNDLIQKVKPDIIDWDPLNSLTDEDLNADVDMRKVCMKISHVTKQGDISRIPFVVHHALTGKTGAAKAVGWEKSSYGRNSKVLHAWTRAQINLAPRSPDNSTLLIMSCGKNNNGRAFPEVGVRFDEELGIYSLDSSFDPADFREQVGIAQPVKRVFTPQMVVDLHWPVELIEKKPLVKAITDELGCARSRAYELVEDAKKSGLIKFNRITRLYSKR